MKTVRTVADLNALALRSGASVQLDGKTFNAGGERAAGPLVKPPLSVRAPEPAPTPTPAPAPANDDLRELVAALASSQQTIAEALTQALAGKAVPEDVSQTNTAPVLIVAPAPAGPWEIAFEDDERGLPAAAIATSGDQLRRFAVLRRPDGALDRVLEEAAA